MAISMFHTNLQTKEGTTGSRALAVLTKTRLAEIMLWTFICLVDQNYFQGMMIHKCTAKFNRLATAEKNMNGTLFVLSSLKKKKTIIIDTLDFSYQVSVSLISSSAHCQIFEHI